MAKRSRKYPLAMTTDAKKAKSVLKNMTPENFLEDARPLHIGHGDRKIIDKFKRDIKSGDPLGPLKLYADGTEDGRHRATAAKELGVKKVPVIDKRKGKKRGGRLLQDQFPSHYMPGVGRQVMQDGGMPGDDASRFVRGEISRPTAAEQARIDEILRPSALVDQYRGYGAEQAVRQNVARPMPTAHEFVQHQLAGNEPQLPQKDTEAVENWKEGAKTLAHVGAYGIPVVGEGLAAYDMGKAALNMASPEYRDALASGDYTKLAGGVGDLAMSAFGAPGRAAKGAAAIGAAAAGLTPEEAKASFFSEAAHMSPAIRKALEAAKRAISEGASPSETWMQHGWAPDPSGKMVSELSDAGARLIPEGLERFRKGEGVFLGEILSHPELYDLYPRSASRSVLPFNEDITHRGYYNPMKDMIGANIKLSDRDLLENLLHEHQHRIQHVEGMSPGTNPEMMLGPEEIARPFIDERAAIQGAIELQRIMHANPRMSEVDALMHAKEKGIPIATGAFTHVRKPYESLLEDMNKATAEIEDIRAKTPSKYDQYFRSLGEWTARLPGERLDMTEGQRRWSYPFPENFPVIVRPPSGNVHDNPRMAGWEASRDQAIELAKRLQENPLPPKFGIEPEKDWELEEDLMKMAQDMEARKRAGISRDPLGPVVPPTTITRRINTPEPEYRQTPVPIMRRVKAGGGVITKALGKLLPAGSGYVPRKGFTANVNLPGFGSVEARPIQPIEDVARKFSGAAHDEGVTAINPDFAARVARAYEAMRHDPDDPVVRRAYDALAAETMDQYRAAKDLGLDIRFLKPGQADPYAASPALGYEDIVNRGRMFVFPTESGFGSSGEAPASNVLLKRAGRIGDKEDAVVNDAFRVIHDLYGHFGPGNPFFRAPGEERAYQLHSRMFSPEARPALTSETRGQNSWVNYGPLAERNRLATGETTHYADQKTGLMPEWTMKAPPPEGTNIESYIREGKAGGGLITKALQAAVPYVERMAPMHQLEIYNLEKARDMGALAAPSIGIGKPATNPLSFGDITLIGRKHLAEPSAENPIFGQDVWTPRVPRMVNYNHKDFTGPGFYSYAVHKDVPATLENIIAHMKKLPVIGGEYATHNEDIDPQLGYLVARAAPKFKTFEDVVGSRERIVPHWDWTEAADKLEKEHTKLAERLVDRKSIEDLHPNASPENYFDRYLLAKMRERETPWGGKTSHLYYPGMTEQEHADVGSHLQDITNMPSRYFEGKQFRPVKGEEFAGAVVSRGAMGRAEPALRQMGIDKIVPYESSFQKPGTIVLENFPEHHFASGGVVPKADDEQFFRRLALWTYAVAPMFSGPHNMQRHGFAGGGNTGKLIEQAVKAAKMITSKGEPTVSGMTREAPLYPDVYKNPRLLAEEAESRVVPENPLLKRLWGVDRQDMFDIASSRPGNREPVLAAPPERTRGINYAAEGVMTPANVSRLQNILDEGYNQPGLRTGMMPWYYMDPVYQRLEQMFGPEGARNRYNLFNTSTSMMSPASNVPTEINRGLGAYHLALQGRFDDFVRGGGKPSAAAPGVLPSYMTDRMKGHLAHSTSQAGPLSKYIETGDVEMGSPKVPLYIQSSGVPETGFQTKLPVPDAHWTRILGMPDVRRTADPEVSMKMNEYRPVGPWFREEVAKPREMEAVPAQALLWGTGSGATGVDSPIGAPKLEMLSQHIGDVAKHYRISPETARDLILQGTLYSKGGSVVDRALDVVSSLSRD